MAETDEYGTVAQVLEDLHELSTFNHLVRRSGLVVTLDGDGPFTVFAPTNAAFDRLPERAIGAVVNESGRLERVMAYHVATGRYTADDLADGAELPTLSGLTLSVILAEPGPWVGGSRVVRKDIGADNGVVHLVDAVMFPS